MDNEKLTAGEIAATAGAGIFVLLANLFGCLVSIGSAVIGLAVVLALARACTG